MRITSLASAALLLAAAAAAAPGDRKFAIEPPCDLKQTDDKINVVMACTNADGTFTVEALLIPEPKPRDELIGAATAKIADELGAFPRINRDIVRNDKTGRETVTDLPGKGLTERDQFWISPYILFAIRFRGVTGTENGMAATKFLESFSASP